MSRPRRPRAQPHVPDDIYDTIWYSTKFKYFTHNKKCECLTSKNIQCNRWAVGFRNYIDPVCEVHFSCTRTLYNVKKQRRRWTIIRSVMKLLSLHQRAVVTANHPLRKMARGEFDCDD